MAAPKQDSLICAYILDGQGGGREVWWPEVDAWTPEAGFDLSVRLERAVGQLNFGDFLAAVNLNNNNQSGANNELRPDQQWFVEIEATRDFGAWASATLRTFIRRFEDLVVWVQTEAGGEARGNVGWARVTVRARAESPAWWPNS